MTATAAPPTSYGVTLANDGPFPRTEWREIGIPTAIAEQLLRVLGGIALRTDDVVPKLIPCRPGNSSPDVWFFWARVSLPAHTIVHWRLVSAEPEQAPAVTMHPYVGDDLRELLTSFEVVDANNQMHTLEPTSMSFEVAEMGSARNVYVLRGFVPGTPLHVQVNAYVYDLQAHVRLEVFVGLGGTTIGRDVVSYPVRSIVMKCGEAIAIQHKHRCGVVDTTRTAAGDWLVLLSSARSIGRGELLPYFGWMLCLPSTPSAPSHDHAIVVENFQGIMNGDTCAATFEGWDGHYSAFRAVPVLPATHSGWPAAHTAAEVHETAQRQRGDMYDLRPMGSAKYAGQTGSQEDFAAGQDLIALRIADPRRQDALQFSSHGWFLRPFHNRDDLARPIRFRDHNRCRTWSQVPEQRVGSADSLGWPPRLPYSWPSSGYSSMDDQHRSQELITCWAHLVDSLAIQQLLFDFAQMDLGQAKVYQGGSDSPRAEGRCLSAWADMLGLMQNVSEATELEAHGHRRLNILDRGWVGRGLPEDRVRPLALGTNPDIYQHTVPVVVWWEHSLAAMGLYAWWKRTGSSVARELCRITCEQVVRWGTFEWQGEWWCALAQKWLADGVPLPEAAYQPESADVVMSAGDWWTWMLPPALILEHEWPTSPHAGKARRCLVAIYGSGPRTEVQAEWWAVVPHRDWLTLQSPDVATVAPSDPVPQQERTRAVDESVAATPEVVQPAPPAAAAEGPAT